MKCAITSVVLLAVPIGCDRQPSRPPTASARTLTNGAASDALTAMLRSHPDAFRMASARVAPEETNLFQIDLARDSYHIAIDSGACIFDYDGSFAFRDGAWSASVPVLASVGKVGR